ncbi:hypothetical protein HK097_009926 [Rhizophlyctis rosea]|uniref:Uncharacterized protein n=1 Tax=Rhizophlyctis rosea TaxID=64517 RepID=A0AAD5X9D2_9FUNG|nr:hypothetical protein HK097_009926 [Rhizophlyctis rosea]
MEEEQRKHSAMQARVVELKEKWVRQCEDMEREHRKKLEEVEGYYREKIKQKDGDVDELKTHLQKYFQTHSQNLIDISTDTDHEILTLHHSFELGLKKERDSLSSIKDENAAMLNRFRDLMRQIDEQKEANARMEKEEGRLKGIIKGLERDVLGVRREMQERDETIQDKEKRIYDLKKKNQELEKFKFVLDYKIMELKKQVEPRERDIVTLSEQIQEMDAELHTYQLQHDDLENTIRDLAMKLRAARNEGECERWREREVQATIQKISSGLEEVWREKGRGVADMKVHGLSGLRVIIRHLTILTIVGAALTQRALVALHHKFLPIPSTPPPPPDPSIRTSLPSFSTTTSISSLLRAPIASETAAEVEAPLEEALQAFAKREHLEHTISVLQHRLEEEEAKRFKANVGVVKENGILLRELNTLRKDLHASTMRAQRLTEIAKTGKVQTGDEEFLKPLLARDGVKKFRTGTPTYSRA